MPPTEIQTSLIIISWNSAEHLKTCLDKLSLQINTNFETILIDNGSSDVQSIESSLTQYKNLNITFKKNNKNLGFAVANNMGASFAKGKWIALLNADAFPEPN